MSSSKVKSSAPQDASNGWDAVAEEFMRRRTLIGLSTVRRWTKSLPKGGSVLDVGAGTGEPLTAALVDAGFKVSAIDASAAMVKAFRQSFPGLEVACEAAERSDFFHRTFDGVLAVGLVFLLCADDQPDLIRRMGAALKPGGRLLFTAPSEVCTWDDLLTGRPSVSLGGDAYRRIVAACGMSIVGEYVDEGDNNYFDARKPVCGEILV